MKHTVPLTENRDFRRLYTRGKSCATRLVVLYAMKNRGGHSRMGITVSKKLGGAVQRNRAKRLLRESYRLLEEQIVPGYDMVLVARTATVRQKQPAVQRALAQGLAALHLLQGEDTP